MKYKYSDITKKIIGCAMEVHSILGNGFQEVICQRALEIELKEAGLQYVRKFDMSVMYKEIQIGNRRVDFLIEDKISCKLKAVIELEKVHLAQAINYLEAYNLEIGLLLNFGNTRLQFHRLENNKFKL